VAAAPSSVRSFEKGVPDGSEEKGKEEVEEEGLTFSGFTGAPIKERTRNLTSKMRWTGFRPTHFSLARMRRTRLS
jgi:hypothetical protein